VPPIATKALRRAYSIRSMSNNEVSRLCQNSVIANNQMSDINTQTEHRWNENDMKLIDEYRIYYYECMLLIEELAKKGPIAIDFPKKPKGNLEQLLNQEIRNKQPPSVNELQTLLESHFVANPHYFSTIIKVADVSPIYLSNLDSLKRSQDTNYSR